MPTKIVINKFHFIERNQYVTHMDLVLLALNRQLANIPVNQFIIISFRQKFIIVEGL